MKFLLRPFSDTKLTQTLDSYPGTQPGALATHGHLPGQHHRELLAPRGFTECPPSGRGHSDHGDFHGAGSFFRSVPSGGRVLREQHSHINVDWDRFPPEKGNPFTVIIGILLTMIIVMIVGLGLNVFNLDPIISAVIFAALNLLVVFYSILGMQRMERIARHEMAA
ncbi:hypothetical protein [Arthrobacter sp. MMS18-M83]|uniref:hypothetical protein n=1 Tax=Arthrobacter sp. MMS18-M83 TaxID=2996261 RepID=UPI00227A5A72|nr:hypothetical protein [Arthrobacter sp. MMS18-M83]WAH98787.1 hypothetical protein OW521_08150 [Arthrobacter sp. MMS18-M83]